MSFATDDEIKIAHDILLKGKKTFDENRIGIIKEDGSCYVQASPGSGKTTALLAKLIILANRMPLPDGKGVCVLTHTNVAIDEIKAKLGSKVDSLFRYPNFFGTIQTFLHKYVTAAALHYFYGSQIVYVDNDIARAVSLKKYDKLTYENKLKRLIYAHTVSKKHIIDADEIETLGGVDMLMAANVIKKSGKRVSRYDFQLGKYDLSNVPQSIKKLIRAKKEYIIDSQGKEIMLSFKIDWLNQQVITDNGSIGVSTESGKEFVKLKEEMFTEGILSFDDAYDLAFRYIREKKLKFSDFSDRRFKYLFVDEVQDCNKKQVELINDIFADDKVIVQRFGDYCQSIFDQEESAEDEGAELKDENVLYIHDSNRFGENIAKPLRTLCMENNCQLVGNEDIPSVRPQILTYEDPLAVLPKYVEMLKSTLIPEKDNQSVWQIANIEKQEDPLHRINIKACGWVGKKNPTDKKRFIESYFPSFERRNHNHRVEGISFYDFLQKDSRWTVRDYATSIIQGILKYLDLCNVKNGNRRYTITSFLESITTSTKEELLIEVMNWSLRVAKSQNDKDIRGVIELIYHYVTTAILPICGKVETKEAQIFFNNTCSVVATGVETECRNIYHVEDIDIEVSTVHAVKGETHASTLYLETSYYGAHESERLAEQFKGVPYSGTDKRTLMNLRVAYVGMSRPRYLLCVAIQKDRFERMDCPELREIWDVVESD